MASRRCCPSLLGGILWTGLGVLFLLRNFGIGPSVWQMIGRYWPILLILLGLGKVIEYYRQTEGVSLRIGEIIGLFFLVIIGSALSRVSEMPMGDLFWRTPIRIGESEVNLGNSYSYTQEATFPVSPETPIRIDNSYGAVTVTSGSEREVRVRLKKVVFSDEESQAKNIASQIEISGSPEGGAEATTFVLKTNRDALAPKNYRFDTNMEVFVPRKVQLKIANSFGDVSVSGLEGKLDAATTQKTLDVRDFAGDVTASNRYGESRLSDITGSLTVDTRGRVEVDGVKGKVDIGDEYSPISVKRVEGPLTVRNTESSITVEDSSAPVVIDAQGSQVTARGLTSTLQVKTSHRRVQVSDIGSDVTLNTQYATVSVKQVKGSVTMESNSDRLTCEEIGGGLKVRARGTSVRANGVKGPVDVESTLKDVIVDKFENSCRVTDEYADVSLSTAAAGKFDISVTNRNGAIELSLPADAAFQIEASASNGQIESDFPGLKPERAAGDVATLQGRLKTGGPKIVLRTEYSNINLRTLSEDKEGGNHSH